MNKIKDGFLNIFWSGYHACKEYFANKKATCVTTLVLSCVLLLLQFLRGFAYVREYVFSRGISRWLLYLLSRYSNLFSFSLSELGIYAGCIIGVWVLVKVLLSLKKAGGVRDFSYAIAFLHFCVNVVLCVVIMFLTLFTMSYERDSAIPQLGLPEVEINAQTVSQSAIYFAEKAVELEDLFEVDENYNVISPYTFEELSTLILEEYKQFEGNDYFSQFETYPKELALGFVNSYAGFSGYYSPFFAESNINTYSPTISQPVTIAHELAHSKGIMRENEANFYAYFILANSDDEYLQYCGYIVISQILLAESYDSNNPEIYSEVLSHFSEKSISVINAKYYFWQEYDTIFDDIGEWFNNLYLTSSGVSSGVKNYGETADILVRLAYFMQEAES